MPPIKRLASYIATALLVVAAVAGLAVYRVNLMLNAELTIDGDARSFEIRPGMSFAAVSRELAEQGIIDRPQVLTFFGRVTGKAGKVHAGEYLIEPGLNMRTLLDKFVSGEVKLYSFTIVEGWTFREM